MQLIRSLLMAATLATLSACGSGDGLPGTDERVASSASVNLSASWQPDGAVWFSWPANAQATYFELIEDVDGEAGPAGAQVIARLNADVLGYRLDRPLLVGLASATYALRVCNASACSTSASIHLPSNLLNGAIVYAKAPFQTGAGDFFGSGLALSGDGRLMAVGSPADNQWVSGVDPTLTGVTADRVGAVFVLERGASGWHHTSYIKAGAAAVNTEFGGSVSLSQDGRVMMVGAARQDDGANDSGAVYFFRRQVGGNWAEEATFKAPVPQLTGNLGARVALSASGEWAVASHHNTAGGGEVLVYRYVAGVGWGLVQTLTGSNTEAGDGFGAGLAISEDGQVIAAGAPFEDSADSAGAGDNSVSGAGAVYVFRQNAPGVWAESAFLKATNTTPQARFGLALAMSANGARLVVGGPQEGAVSGSLPFALVFEAGGAGAWTVGAQLNALASGLFTEFGRSSISLSADGNLVAIGAHEEDGDGLALNGFLNSSGAHDSGAVFVYRRDGAGVWSSPTYVKAGVVKADIKFGASVALAADGRSLAVAAPGDSSAATGMGGNQNDTSAPNAGAVYIY